MSSWDIKNNGNMQTYQGNEMEDIFEQTLVSKPGLCNNNSKTCFYQG